MGSPSVNMTVVGATIPYSEGSHAITLNSTALKPPRTINRSFLKIIKILFGNSSLGDSSKKEIIHFWKSCIQNYPSSITKAVAGVIQRQGVFDELKNISIPTLIAVGEEDIAIIPAKSERIHHEIKGSKLVTFPKAGHSSCIEQPQIVSKIISDFIRIS